MSRWLFAAFVCSVVLCCGGVDGANAELSSRLSMLEEEVKELRELARQLLAAKAAAKAAAEAEAAAAAGLVAESGRKERSLEERRLATGNGTKPAITFQHPDARIKFASGASLYETAPGVLKADASFAAAQNVLVQGTVTSFGRNLNLGMPFTAVSSVTQGSIVSLSSTGGVMQGFGMQLSTPMTAVGVIANPILLNMTGSVVVLLYNDTNYYGQAVYYDTSGSSASAPVAISGTDVLWDMTATRVTATTFVVCYRRLSASTGRCALGTINSVTQSVSFGSAYDVFDSAGYIDGAVTNLEGVSDRVVLSFAVSVSESSKVIVIGISGTSLSTVTPSGLTRFQYSSMSDHMTAVSLSASSVLIAYRLPRDSQAYLNRLYFNPGDNANIFASVAYPIVSPASPLQFLTLARLNSTFGVLVYRNPNVNWQVQTSLVDTTNPLQVVIWPATVISPGSPQWYGLSLSVAVVSSNRVVYSYNDGFNQAYVQDAGVYGSSIIMGTAQLVYRGTNTTSNFTALVGLGANALSVVTQSSFTPSVKGANFFQAQCYGGPFILGFAKTSAAAPGASVTVSIWGGQDGYSGLVPGAGYFARYDGGIAASSSVSGASSTLVGRAIASDVLYSLLNTDGVASIAAVASTISSMASLSALVTSFNTRIARLEGAFVNSHWYNPNVPVYYWAVFSTYSQYQSWYLGNDASMYMGVNPSNWGDSSYYAAQIASDKEQWRTMLTKRGYGGKNAMIWADEWYYYSSTNSRHITLLFRINNPTSSAISWTPYFYFSSYGGWSEAASVSLNGANNYYQTGNCAMCTAGVTMSIPANRISNVIFVIGSGYPSTTRTLQLAFYSNSLALPSGLSYVDDLMTATGGWES